MPFARQTLTQLRDGALQDVAAGSIYDTTTQQVVNPILLQFDPLTIEAKMMAGLAYQEFEYLDYIALQATPFTAVDEIAVGWGAMVGITTKQATAATGTATFSGIAGKDIPSGTLLVRTDGVTYLTTADEVVPIGGVATVPYVASVPGAAGTLAAGAVISLASNIAGVTKEGFVASSTAPGADVETVDSLKARYLARYAASPQGGAAPDYKAWALAVPGVTRAWVRGSVMGPGTVGVYVMLDISEAPGGGFPVGTNGISPHDNTDAPRDTMIATGDQLTVANAIVVPQPVTALVYVLAPVATPINFVIAALGTGNTLGNQAAIKAALTAMFLSIGDVAGVSIYPSAWNGAVASVPGLGTFNITTPSGPVTIAAGHLPTLGTSTFST